MQAKRPLKRLASFAAAPEVLLNGHETIYRNGKAIGYVRRATFGYSLNKSIGTGYVDLNDLKEGQKIKDFVMEGKYQIDVLGTLHDVDISLTALYDPKKLKMNV